jgi:hypothetical protein
MTSGNLIVKGGRKKNTRKKKKQAENIKESRSANTGFMLLLRLGFFKGLVSYIFSFLKHFFFKSFRYICFGL